MGKSGRAPTAQVIYRKGKVPSSVPIVFADDDPARTRLQGMPSIALWEEIDRTGEAQWARLDSIGFWQLVPEPDAPYAVKVRVGKEWHR